jgi:uncharacterized protein YegJ (DUF2314 family)
MNRIGILVATLLVAAALGCGESDSGNVVHVSDTDPAMNKAMADARATVDQFADALRNPGKRSDFSLKARFTEGSTTEHMWVNEVRVEGDVFKGKVGNDPDNLKKVRFGQSCSIPRDRVSDWMYVENGKLVGGTTLRVLRDKMSPAERKKFDASLPFTIEGR